MFEGWSDRKDRTTKSPEWMGRAYPGSSSLAIYSDDIQLKNVGPHAAHVQ